MERDNDGLLVELIKLKEVIDQLSYVFHKISVNPHSGGTYKMSASSYHTADILKKILLHPLPGVKVCLRFFSVSFSGVSFSDRVRQVLGATL
jgi:hypothetical protein